MVWDRAYLKRWVKLRYGFDPDKDDGLVSDADLHVAIDVALRDVAQKCHLLAQEKKFPLVSGQWEYPMPEDLVRVVDVLFIDSNGTHNPLRYYNSRKFIEGRDPEDDTSSEPSYYTYPKFQRRVLQFYADAPPVYDYIDKSWVTSGTKRTVVDSGANFGKLLDGTRVEPGGVVHNLDDGSYGYVEILDTITNTTTGTATSGTNTNTLEDTTKDFTALGVEETYVICTPSSSVVTSYAFVTAVGTTTVTYGDFQNPDNTVLRFKSGDSYKIGKAQKIRLSGDAPHPGLREGATNDFTVGSAKCTITGTTFTVTTVTGSSTSGAESGDIAIASGGSHGEIASLTGTVLTIDKWIGGQPADGETVTVKECDQYQIESQFRIERVIQLGPTPSASDDIGSESMLVLYSTFQPPEEDDDPIEIPQDYVEAIQGCLRWKVAELMPEYTDAEIKTLEQYYLATVARYTGDIYRPPDNEPISPWTNRRRAKMHGAKDETASGVKWGNLPV